MSRTFSKDNLTLLSYVFMKGINKLVTNKTDYSKRDQIVSQPDTKGQYPLFCSFLVIRLGDSGLSTTGGTSAEYQVQCQSWVRVPRLLSTENKKCILPSALVQVHLPHANKPNWLLCISHKSINNFLVDINGDFSSWKMLPPLGFKLTTFQLRSSGNWP